MSRAGIETIADLRAVPLERLLALFGRHGRWLYDCARGIDERPVRVERERKSLSHEQTFARDLERLTQMDEQLDHLARRVAGDLGRRQLSACTLTLKVRYADFTTLTRSHTLSTPTSDPVAISVWAKSLLRRTDAGRRRVRLLGLGASNLVRGDLSQLELFG
jgi:DNA polymerase-4